jgi:Asp-tRNA(Asn)/Glu-tRNA(Gln) amidotransferase A subunit family amidase
MGDDRKPEPAELKGKRSGIPRRDLVKGALAGGLAALTGQSGAQTPSSGEAITAADFAVSDKLTGHSYTEAERTLMARSAGRIRGSLKALRNADLDLTVEPASHFDPRLPNTPIPRGKPGFRLSSGPTPPYNGHPESLAFASAVELSRLIKARKVTSVALTKMYLERLKKFGPRLNNVVTLTEDLAMEHAVRADREMAEGHYRGPLHGIPWGVKDLLNTKGIRTTYGAKPYENQVFDFNATVVNRLEEAGAVLVAKLSMGELAQGDLWYGGLTRNPWKPATGSSGSSAGPGSATAAGLVGFAIGSETLGSIVSPSVVNGVTGLRPTYGRVSRYGAMALCWTMDKLGPMARGVEDCAMVLNAIYGPDGKDGTAADVPFSWNPATRLSSLRVGIDSAAFDRIAKDENRKKTYADVLDALKKLGITLKPVTLPKQTEAYGSLASIIIDVESSAAFAKLTASGKLDLLARQIEGAWPNTFRIGSTIPAADYLQALRVRARLQQEMADSLKDVDLYVTVPFQSPSLVYTNLTGHPTVVTRCGMRDGLPEMVEFTGQLYREDAILRVAHAFEQATPWHKQWPDTEKIPLLAETRG